MEVIKRSTTVNGVKIQIENWSKDYPNIYKENSTIALYPKSKANISSNWCNFYPRIGESFRIDLNFNDSVECKNAFNLLVEGKKNIIDFIENYRGNISKENLIRCI